MAPAGKSAPRRALFEEEGGEEAVELGVNKEFAKRFQHNKEREELHRLREKQRKGLLPADGDSSSSEEEDDGDIRPETEVKILDVIKRIRSKDPSIYDSKNSFFGEQGGEDEEGEEGSESEGGDSDGEEGGGRREKGGKPRPVYLKDVIAREALARAAGEASDSDEEADGEAQAGPTYVEEQSALKDAFKQAAAQASGSDSEEEGGEGGGLVRRRAAAAAAEAAEAPAGGGEARVNALLSEVFGGGEGGGAPSEGDRFLRSFIMNKGWVDPDDEDAVPTYQQITGGLSEDEEDLDEQETFEAQHNFRYEEEGSGRIATHSRQVADSIRKTDDRRKRGREARKTRKDSERAEADVELKRLKNIKKKDLQKKIDKMRRLAGKGAAREEALLAELLEKDFDPEEYDAQMAAAFGEEYYRQGVGAGAEEEKEVLDPAVAKELKSLGGSELEGSSELANLRERLGLGGDEEWEDEMIGEWDEEAAAARVAADEEGGEEGGDPEASKAAVLKALEEYYKLDYEQDIGGLKCRFNYRQVDKEDFGLQPTEVLGMQDKELNELVGMRLLAPYREDGWRLKKTRYKVQAALGPKRRAQEAETVWRAARKEQKQAAKKEAKVHAKKEGGKALGGSKEVKEVKKVERKKAKEPKKKVRNEEKGEKKPPVEETSKGKKRKAEEAEGNGAAKEAEVKAVAKGPKDSKKGNLEARKSSYAIPKLSRPESASAHSKKEKKRKEEAEAAPGPKAGLTRAAKKNARRAEKRAAKRIKTE
eukprot:jgi/Tetstr1/423474/TSEL_014155.t1